MQFNSNGSLKLGPSAVTFGPTESACEVTIPAAVRARGRRNERAETRTFEEASYSTEKEKLEGGPAKKFGEFRERLDVEWEAKGITTTVKLTPTCKYRAAA